MKSESVNNSLVQAILGTFFGSVGGLLGINVIAAAGMLILGLTPLTIAVSGDQA